MPLPCFWVNYAQASPVLHILHNLSAVVYPYDPTNGAIMDALKIAADKVEIDGISAKEALDEAQKTAQSALDEALGQ